MDLRLPRRRGGVGRARAADEADVRARCLAYRMALPDAGSAHAGKAFLCRAMVTLYRVLAVEEAGSAGMLAAVDGGMSDKPQARAVRDQVLGAAGAAV